MVTISSRDVYNVMQCKTSIFIEHLSYTLQDTFFMSRPCIGSSSFMTLYAFCPRAKSAPVERRFSHCGLFVRSHQARIGRTFQFQLTLAKCNRCSLLHCLTVICLDTRVLANVPVSGKNVLPRRCSLVILGAQSMLELFQNRKKTTSRVLFIIA